MNDALQRGQVEGLKQAVVGAQLHRLDDRAGARVPGDANDRGGGVDVANLLEDLQARLVRQPQVQNDHVGRMAAGMVGPDCARLGEGQLVRRPGEGVAPLLRRQPQVLADDKHLGRSSG